MFIRHYVGLDTCAAAMAGSCLSINVMAETCTIPCATVMSMQLSKKLNQFIAGQAGACGRWRAVLGLVQSHIAFFWLSGQGSRLCAVLNDCSCTSDTCNHESRMNTSNLCIPRDCCMLQAVRLMPEHHE